MDSSNTENPRAHSRTVSIHIYIEARSKTRRSKRKKRAQALFPNNGRDPRPLLCEDGFPEQRECVTLHKIDGDAAGGRRGAAVPTSPIIYLSPPGNSFVRRSFFNSVHRESAV